MPVKLKHPAKGAVFSRLTVLGASGPIEGRGTFTPVKCVCGKHYSVKLSKLLAGTTTSCGCARTERFTAFATKHGHRFKPEYQVWLQMRQRCTNPKNKGFVNYGARGISVCRRWDSFENFFKDMGERPFPEAQLDREKNNRGYSKANCRWVTRNVNAQNTRSAVTVNYLGKKAALADVARELGVAYSYIYWRLKKKKMSFKKILKELQ